MLLLNTHCSHASFHPYEVDDHIISKILSGVIISGPRSWSFIRATFIGG